MLAPTHNTKPRKTRPRHNSARSAMAPTPDPPLDRLSALPTELRCAIARNIVALDDHKALVLVNRTWAEVALPFLWNTFVTDLVPTANRDILGLTHSKSNIVKHVQNMKLLARSTSRSPHLTALLAAIPRGQLKGFTSANEVSTMTMNILLQMHPMLAVLDVPTQNTLDCVLQSPWTVGSWSNLKSMVLDPLHILPGSLQVFWNICTNLQALELRHPHDSDGVSRLYDESFLFTSDLIPPRSAVEDFMKSSNPELNALGLKRLLLDNIQLPKCLDGMFRRIDVLALHELTLDTFVGSEELLEAMAIQFGKGQPCLKKLSIINLPRQTAEQFVTSLFVFLASFRGLEKLHMHCRDCHKIDVDGIANHGEHLKSLFIVNGGIHRKYSERCFDASDLRRLAVACPALEHICLNLFEIDPDRNESDALGPRPGEAFTPNAFEEALGAMSSMKSLRTLRLSNPPEYRKAYRTPGELGRFFHNHVQCGYERHKFQARAEGIIQYMGARGSNIEGLAFAPVERLPQAGKPDKMGHVWPTYYYYRGNMTDRKGVDLAVARPFTDWNGEFPEAAI